MSSFPIQIGHVAFDAHSRRIEARVTVHDGAGPHHYDCRIDASPDLSFDRAAHRLSRQALRRHTGHR